MTEGQNQQNTEATTSVTTLNESRVLNLLDRDRLWLWVTVALVFLIRIPPALREQLYCMDEGLTLGVGSFVEQGGLSYVDGICQRGPLFHATAAVFIKFFGWFSVIGWNLFGVLFFAATVVLIRIIARELYGNRVANLAPVLFVIFESFAFMVVVGFGLNAEIFGNVPAALSVLLLIYAYKKGSYLAYFFSGYLVMVGALYKQVIMAQAILIALVALIALAREWKSKGAIMRFVLRGIISLVGFAIPMLVVFYVYDKAGKIWEFWFWFYEYNTQYSKEGMARIRPMLLFGWFLFQLFVALLPITVGVILATGRTFSGGFFKKLRESVVNNAEGIIGFAWVAITMGTVFMAMRHHAHYFIYALPALCVFGGWGIVSKFEERPEDSSKVWKALRHLVAVGMIGTVIMIGISFRSWGMNVFRGAVPGLEAHFNAVNPYFKVAKRVEQLTRPGDRIFVWGFKPRIYPVSQRRPATRYVSAYYLTGQFGGLIVDPKAEDLRRYIIPGQWKLALDELNQRKPAAIIDTAVANTQLYFFPPMVMFPLMKQLVDANYVKTETVNGFDIYLRNMQPWTLIRYDHSKEYIVPYGTNKPNVWVQKFKK